ncbi:proline dehydrogenase, partial [Halobium palmae]
MIPPIASRFVAGETPPVAFDHARRANEDGVKVILNLLGEHYDERAPADADAAA